MFKDKAHCPFPNFRGITHPLKKWSLRQIRGGSGNGPLPTGIRSHRILAPTSRCRISAPALKMLRPFTGICLGRDPVIAVQAITGSGATAGLSESLYRRLGALVRVCSPLEVAGGRARPPYGGISAGVSILSDQPTFTLRLIVFEKYCAGLFDQGGSRYPKTFRPFVDRIQELGRE